LEGKLKEPGSQTNRTDANRKTFVKEHSPKNIYQKAFIKKAFIKKAFIKKAFMKKSMSAANTQQVIGVRLASRQCGQQHHECYDPEADPN
jgi:hypothetical protein